MATGGLWLRLLGKSAGRKDFNSSSAPFVRAWRGAGHAAGGTGRGRGTQGEDEVSAKAELMPFPKGEKRMTWFLLCPRAEKFGRCLQSACGAASVSPPAPFFPGCRRVVSPLGGGCSQARLADAVGCESGGCCYAWWICTDVGADDYWTYAYGLNVCYMC